MGIYLGTTKLDVMPDIGKSPLSGEEISCVLSGIHAKNNLIYPDTQTWTLTSDGIIPTNYKDNDSNQLHGYAVNLQVTAIPKDLSSIFEELNYLHYINLTSLNTSKVESMKNMFASCGVATLDVSHFDTSRVTDMSYMFYYCTLLTTLDVSHFDTSRVTNMSSMFEYCKQLTTLDVSHFNTSRVTDMSSMFDYCEQLTTLDVSHFNTSQVTNMSRMFALCTLLTTLDVSHFNTSQVTNMSRMFYYCRNLKLLDLSSFDTSAVTNMEMMFDNCDNLKTVYCRTQADADKLKTASAAPATINFVVK